jgi:hypothetical protein
LQDFSIALVRKTFRSGFCEIIISNETLVQNKYLPQELIAIKRIATFKKTIFLSVLIKLRQENDEENNLQRVK